MIRHALLILLALLGSLAGVFAAEIRLAGHRPAAAMALQPLGEAPGNMPMQLAVELPLRNTNELAELLRRLYDPADPQYHHFLTPKEFAERFAPAEEDYQKVIAFARTHHLALAGTHANRLLIDVRGTAEEIGQTFQLRLLRYHHPSEKRDFYAPDADPAVESGMPIMGISGLSDFQRPRPRSHASSLDALGVTQAKNGSAAGGAYSGGDFRAAYLPGITLNGAGQSVGLVEFDGFYTNDIARYNSQAGLAQIPLQIILINQFNGIPTGDTNANAEVSLDIELTTAMAPGLAQILVYEASPTNSPEDILNQMAVDNAARQLSCSWGWTGGPNAMADQIFQEMAAQGQTFLCASGDDDAYPAGTIDNAFAPNAPADSPYLTSVGGTTLVTSGPAGSWVSESVWNSGGGKGSGGGVSSYYAIPAWQQGISVQNNGGSSSKRNIPDVALTADNIYVAFGNGKGGPFNGTSCAAALWGGFVALVNQTAAASGISPVGFINPAIYQIGAGQNYSAAFHDVTTGNNFSSASPSAYFATTGFDLCTGWGTPAGNNLISALTAPADPLKISPPTGFTAAGLAGGPFNFSSENLFLTNASSNAITWSAGSGSAWLSVSLNEGALAMAGSAVTVTASLNTDAASLAAGSYVATVWFTNLATGNVQDRQFTLNVITQLVQNGSFETGSFSAWTSTGNLTNVSVTFNSSYVHSGTYGAQFGPAGSLGFLSQGIPTVPGVAYVISFWVDNPLPGIPNELNVSWNGNIIFDQTNLPGLSWTNLQFVVTASNANSVLQFGLRDDPAYLGLDDVSVTPVPLPVITALSRTNSVTQFSWNARPGLSYEVQTKTDLAQASWLNAGNFFTATNSILTFADADGSSAQKFYRVVIVVP